MVETMNFINSTHLFNIMHDKVGSMHKVLLLPNKVQWFQGKSLLKLFEL